MKKLQKVTSRQQKITVINVTFTFPSRFVQLKLTFFQRKYSNLPLSLSLLIVRSIRLSFVGIAEQTSTETDFRQMRRFRHSKKSNLPEVDSLNNLARG